MKKLFNFKITNLNDSVVKCGFPESKLEFYTNLLDKCNVEFKVISSITTSKKVENLSAYLNDEQAKNVLKIIKNIDMNNISFRESFELLEKFHKNCKINYKEYYILKCDISKFFASIDHDNLKEKLKRKIKDKDALKIVFDIIDSDLDGLSIGYRNFIIMESNMI